MQRRRRDLGERRKLRRRRWKRAGAVGGEELQLPVLSHGRRLFDGLRLGCEPVEPKQQPCVLALELDRAVGRRLELLACVEARKRPPQRGRGIRRARRIDGAGDDQPVDRPRHRHVVETQPLGPVLSLPRLADLVVAEHAAPAARDRVGYPEAKATVREREQLVRPRRRSVAARVGDDHDLELEPFGGVDRQQPDRVRALLLRDGLELLGPDRLLVPHEAEEALDVAPAQLLVGACQPGQLAEVRVPAAAVPVREDREVVVVLDEDLLAEPLEREPGRGGRQALVALLERAEQPLVVRAELLGPGALEPREDRAATCGPAKQEERVV